jgi:hypothetical protein
LGPICARIPEFHRFGAQWRVNEGQKGHQLSVLRANSLRIRTGNFLRPCRELNRTIREIFPLIREYALVRFLAFALPTTAIVPTDLVFAEKANRVPPDARSRRSRSRARSRLFVQVNGAPGIPENLVAKFVDANKRRFGLRDGGVGAVARRQTYRAPPKLRDRPPFGHAHDAAGCI